MHTGKITRSRRLPNNGDRTLIKIHRWLSKHDACQTDAIWTAIPWLWWAGDVYTQAALLTRPNFSTKPLSVLLGIRLGNMIGAWAKIIEKQLIRARPAQSPVRSEIPAKAIRKSLCRFELMLKVL
jgi:hypothetical protein